MWVLWWPRSVLNTWQNTYTSMITTKRITRGEENFDKLFKVRPPITHLQPKFRDILTFSWKEVCFTVNSSKQTVHMAAGCFQTQMRKAKGAVPLMGEWESLSLATQPFPSCCKVFWHKAVTFLTSYEGAQPAGTVKALWQKQTNQQTHSWCTMPTNGCNLQYKFMEAVELLGVLMRLWDCIELSSDRRSIINGSSSILWTQLLPIPGCSSETTARM